MSHFGVNVASGFDSFGYGLTEQLAELLPHHRIVDVERVCGHEKWSLPITDYFLPPIPFAHSHKFA